MFDTLNIWNQTSKNKLYKNKIKWKKVENMAKK